VARDPRQPTERALVIADKRFRGNVFGCLDRILEKRPGLGRQLSGVKTSLKTL
jgi:hypothetical protein